VTHRDLTLCWVGRCAALGESHFTNALARGGATGGKVRQIGQVTFQKRLTGARIKESRKLRGNMNLRHRTRNDYSRLVAGQPFLTAKINLPCYGWTGS
jgi:hypothetical protein